MRPNSRKPLLASLFSIFSGFALAAFASLAFAQSITDIQQMLKRGQTSQALEKVDLYIASKPKDAQGRFLKGLILTEMGRSADAVAVFTKLTEDFPELPEPYNNLAVLYAQQKQYDKARTALEMAIRTHPSYSIAHENLGDVYAKLASQAYDKALQIDSSNKATQTKLSLIKELIVTSSKPVAKSGTGSRTSTENVKPVQVASADKSSDKKPEKNTPVKVAEQKSTAPGETPAAVSAKPAETKTSSGNAANDTEMIVKTMQNWASAWSKKDVKSYLGFYADNFQTPNGMPRKTWEAERTQRIDKPGKLQVALEDIKVSFSGEKAVVRFRQHYTSATLKSSTGKTAVLVKNSGKWLIIQERVGQ